MTTVNLGDKVRDRITGFEGIVTCRSIWINGCVRCGVQSSKLKEDGKPTESEFIDEGQLEVLEREAIILKQLSAPIDITAVTTAAQTDALRRRRVVGGPRANPTRAKDK